MSAALKPVPLDSGAPVPGALLALNNAHAQELSRLDTRRMAELTGASFVTLTAGEGAALLIAFDEGAAYDSENFLWFRARYPRFIYIDRVVVDPAARGQGLAARLYSALFAQALASGRTLVTCEVNTDPPNPGSMAFHHAQGFAEVGRARLATDKRVAYLARDLTQMSED